MILPAASCNGDFPAGRWKKDRSNNFKKKDIAIMIRLGLYGCGRRTKTLLNSLIQDHFYRVEAAFDQNPSQAETMTAEFGGRICRTADELVASPDVDAFLISLSPFAHAAALKKNHSRRTADFCGKASRLYGCGGQRDRGSCGTVSCSRSGRIHASLFEGNQDRIGFYQTE